MKYTFVLTILLLTSSNLFATYLDNALTRVENETYMQKLVDTRNTNVEKRNSSVDIRDVRIFLNKRSKLSTRKNNFTEDERKARLGLRTLKSLQLYSSL